jgi:hypothetical protein
MSYRVKPWVKMPTRWIWDGRMAEQFRWGNSVVTKSTTIAALQLWVTMLTRAEEIKSKEGKVIQLTDLTYDGLMEITGMSRKLVSCGLDALEETRLIERKGIGRRNLYLIQDCTNGYWCKLPARALYDEEQKIRAFHTFQRRSMCEMDAMKLFLYYAAVRDKDRQYTIASFKTISQKTSVPENRITRANAFLLNATLLSNISHEKTSNKKQNEPNKYYLKGYLDMFI